MRGAVSGQGMFTTQLHGVRLGRRCCRTAARSRSPCGPAGPPASTRRRTSATSATSRSTWPLERRLARRRRARLRRGHPAQADRQRHRLRAGIGAEDLSDPAPRPAQSLPTTTTSRATTTPTACGCDRPAVHADRPDDRLLPGAGRSGHPVRAADRGQHRRLGRQRSSPRRSTPATGWWPTARAPAPRRPRLRHQLLRPRRRQPDAARGQPAGLRRHAGAQAVDRARLPHPDRHRQVPGVQLRPGDLRRAADPGRPAGAASAGPTARRPSHHYDAGWMPGFLGGAMGMLRRARPARSASSTSPARAPCCCSPASRRGRPAPGATARGPGRPLVVPGALSTCRP